MTEAIYKNFLNLSTKVNQALLPGPDIPRIISLDAIKDCVRIMPTEVLSYEEKRKLFRRCADLDPRSSHTNKQ